MQAEFVVIYQGYPVKPMGVLKTLIKQPYQIIALVLGAALVALPYITIDKDNHLRTGSPTSYLPSVVGIGLLIFSAVALVIETWAKPPKNGAGGLDLNNVKEHRGIFSTIASGCEIRVVYGSIEKQAAEPGVAFVLPCNEYFDDRCVSDTKSALGAYVNHVFDGNVEAFISLVKSQCLATLGPGTQQQKTKDETAESFGVGRCLLLTKPLSRSVSVALVSTTTQTAGEGLSARISYLFDGMRALFTCLADARLNRVVMPILGAGHGHIDPPLAFVGLLLAIAEAARYGRGSQRLKEVTIVVFKPDGTGVAQVDKTIVRRALALVGSDR